jgi:hypothetical protein
MRIAAAAAAAARRCKVERNDVESRNVCGYSFHIEFIHTFVLEEIIGTLIVSTRNNRGLTL